MTLLSAEEILTSEDRDYEDVPVPAWGGTVRLRSLSAFEAIEFTDSIKNTAGKKNANAKLLSLSLIDEQGDLLFTLKDMAGLKKKSIKTLNMVASKALVLNGMAEEDDDDGVQKVKNG